MISTPQNGRFQRVETLQTLSRGSQILGGSGVRDLWISDFGWSDPSEPMDLLKTTLKPWSEPMDFTMFTFKSMIRGVGIPRIQILTCPISRSRGRDHEMTMVGSLDPWDDHVDLMVLGPQNHRFWDPPKHMDPGPHQECHNHRDVTGIRRNPF